METVAKNDWVINNPENRPESPLFLKKLLMKFVSLWPWLMLSVILCVAVAFFYLRYAPREYKVHATLLVQDDNKGTDFGETSALEELGLLKVKSNVDNEMEIFRSRTLMETVVGNLQLNIIYLLPGKFKDAELYTKSPVNLKTVDSNALSVQGTLRLSVSFNNKDSLKYSLTIGDKVIEANLGDTILLGQNRVRLVPTQHFKTWPKNQSIYIQVAPLEAIVRLYMARLNVMVPNKQVSIINITLAEAIPAKGEMVVNAIIDSYLKASVNDKNRIADSTMRFIDDRLNLVFNELSDIEKTIEGFKTAHKITDIGSQSEQLLANSSEYARQQTAQEVQLSVVESLEQFLINHQNEDRIVPSSLVMQDPTFLSIVDRYNAVQLQRDKMLMSMMPEHPSISSVNEQIKTLKNELLSSIASIKRGLQVSITELKRRYTAYESKISQVPATERVYLDHSRQQTIKQELYLFLLKKREETAISKSSKIANARIIDDAQADTWPFKPKKMTYLFLGFMIGIIIPFSLSFGKDLLNNKVSSIEDINQVTDVPIIGEIGHNAGNDNLAVTLNSKTLIAEQFRSLRTNMGFLLADDNAKTILLSSSMSGEGKSFLSINLCSAFAIAGKRVILLEFDLRKPKISDTLGLLKQGFTNYIVSGENNWQRWVQTAGETGERFDVLPSGPLPPNPAELLMLPKVASLMEELRKNYDYIIIDSAPIGLVTDAQILAPYANATLYIVRHGLTFKRQISLIDRLYRKRALPGMHILVNDVVIKKNSYGYGYEGYGYGYGLYGENVQQNKKK